MFFDSFFWKLFTFFLRLLLKFSELINLFSHLMSNFFHFLKGFSIKFTFSFIEMFLIFASLFISMMVSSFSFPVLLLGLFFFNLNWCFNLLGILIFMFWDFFILFKLYNCRLFLWWLLWLWLWLGLWLWRIENSFNRF